MSENTSSSEFHGLTEWVLGRNLNSFKQYFIAHDMPLVLERLKSGLDAESLKVIDRDLEKFLNYPGPEWNEVFFVKAWNDLLSSEEKERSSWEIQEINSVMEKHSDFPPWSIFGIASSVYGHGLRELASSEKVMDYIRGKSFVDGGSFWGDSVFGLREYGASKIYSFEIEPANLQKLRQNVARFDENGLVKIVPMALFSHSCHFSFEPGLGDGGCVFNLGESEIEGIALDSFFDVRPEEIPGFLKIELVGTEMEAVEGAKDTITRRRPVLSISIYHNPVEFFELKPMLESWNLGYKFRIRKHQHIPSHYETSLIAYPAELEG